MAEERLARKRIVASFSFSGYSVIICYFVYVKAEVVDYVKFEAIVFYIYIAQTRSSSRPSCAPMMSSTL